MQSQYNFTNFNVWLDDRKLSDGLFLEISREVAKEYPEIEHNDMIIDNCCMQLVSKPHQFDVMLMTNLYGTIVSNVVCGLIGGAGLLSGRNYGNNVRKLVDPWPLYKNKLHTACNFAVGWQMINCD